ncbi:MAG: tRNA (adenosine(37)-N6)-dimethylallyltransferase MiaA [Clostridia bacterium]|nr:tRNA (adenosine(37)-N6)-dimethylallyltransferase MiaA [Clostridia bacterium]
MKGIKTIFVAGPTASGKTALAVALARRFGGEVISADSMQVYRGIHIASAAPDEEEKQGVPHHLLEFLEATEQFSVADYVEKARACVMDIHARGRLPVVAGGTGLYIRSLAENLVFPEEKTDPAVRCEWEERFEEKGGEAMLRELAAIDPVTASRLHPNDRRRIVRAFEIYSMTGKTAAEQNELSRKGETLVKPLIVGLTFSDREQLYRRIDTRVDRMLENGLLEEAKAAYQRCEGGAFQAIGHKELFRYFEGGCSLEEAAEDLKRQTRRYAKRQLTWFRKEKDIHWLFADREDVETEAARLAETFLKEGAP